MILRFDDISCNTDLVHASALADIWRDAMGGQIWYAISPLYTASKDQRIFPAIYNARSDYREFYNVDSCGVPCVPYDVVRCAHGLVHVDHRMLTKSAQEMSIVVSCSIVGGRIFVPPFNKWNHETVDVCAENSIKLVRFEDGWRSVECERFAPGIDKWYLHSRNVSEADLRAWLEDA